MSEAVKHYIDTEQDRADIIEGTKHQQAGRVAEAMTLFRGVLKRNPNSVNAMCHLATLYWQGQKRFEDAEALLRRATQLAPDSFAAWLTLGALFIDREKYLDAINAYENATALDPTVRRPGPDSATPTGAQSIQRKP